ncbi:N-acetyltransferase [Micromonospora costi]|uniref:N-acetyltransferase n=1 Tax=Micromonospora costi TaxID=1530042 RepID=A0A3A9ZPY5_9ACTN|nr:N-acetyltransferase [Micromonospora costi]RKN50233.1 N-acetyltransferase [Micromonospora costi]
MTIDIVCLADRPELAALLDDDFEGAWPPFMLWDPMGAVYYNVAHELYPEFVFAAVDSADPGRAVARAYAVPFRWTEPELPDGGWDRVIQRATIGRLTGAEPTIVSAIEICIRPDRRGGGLSALMLDAMRQAVAKQGYDTLVAPVRPNGKHTRPDLPMAEYAAQVRADGLPVDPWLRVHVRAGGRIERVATRSMTIAGTLADWRRWTGLPFDTSGPVHVPGALVPVHCDVTHDHAVYVEPNVWVRHRL